MTAVIETQSLTVGYDRVPSVRDLSLHVDEGEVVALLGPNGAGKTTTLLAIAGVLAPIEGSIHLLGEKLKRARPHFVARRGLSCVPDDRGLFFGLTVDENLRLARGRGGDYSIVFELFPALEVIRKRRAGLLSGGEQQMLALGRALLRQPRALLIDEMSLGLAPKLVEAILPTIRRVADEFGTAVLLVEQHVDLALDIADRAYVLNHGNMILEGNGRDLRSRPDLIEAGYLGELVYDALDEASPRGAAPSLADR